MQARWAMAGMLMMAACDGRLDTICPPDGCGGSPWRPSYDLGSRAHDQVVHTVQPKVDVLWMVSRSDSMGDEQQALVNGMDEFMDILVESHVDWRVGVTTTDVHDEAGTGWLQQVGSHRFVTDRTEGVQAVLEDLLASVGTSEDAVEGGFAALEAFVEHAQAGEEDFYRPDATLHVIVVSDTPQADVLEDEVEAFTDWLQAEKASPQYVSYSSVVATDPQGCAGLLGDALPAPTYLAATDLLDGVEASICTLDWERLSRDLGIQASGARTEYLLSELPVDGTDLEVWLEVPNGPPERGDWFLYDGVDQADLAGGVAFEDLCPSRTCFTYVFDPVRNAIMMHGYTPPGGSVVHMRYDIAGKQQDVVRLP